MNAIPLPALVVGEARDQSRSQLWRLLARAWQVPAEAGFCKAMGELLVPDIQEVMGELGLDVAIAPLRQLDEQLRQLVEPTQLLVIYSRLFLTPPGAVSLRIGQYLPRADTGECAIYLRRLMAYHGVAARTGVGADGDDHLVTLLEYLAWRSDLLAAARSHPSGDQIVDLMDVHEVRARYLLPALGAMLERARHKEREAALPALYSSLLALIEWLLMDAGRCLFPAISGGRCPGFAAAPVTADTVACQRCGHAIASQADLAIIRQRLLACGLPIEHLTLCSDCRG
jgi:TorA maturation chaperone TorD